LALQHVGLQVSAFGPQQGDMALKCGLYNTHAYMIVPKAYDPAPACDNFKSLINGKANGDSRYMIGCESNNEYNSPQVFPNSGNENDCGYFVARLNTIVNNQPGGAGVNIHCVSDESYGDEIYFGLWESDAGASDYCSKYVTIVNRYFDLIGSAAPPNSTLAKNSTSP